MKASDYLAEALYAQGITHVFELVGGMIVHILDSLHQHGKIQIVSMHHEQAAAFAADAYGRLTGKPGVAMGTSGPGATNLLTGIGSCYFDSSPAVFITGQVNRYEQKRGLQVRQLGFQETDIVSMVKPITKAAWRVETPEEFPYILNEAFRLAMEGRPGPVLIDIPMDIQRAEINPPPTAPSQSETADITPLLDDLFDAMRQSERPLILYGGGIRAARAEQLASKFAQRTGIPVTHSLLAVDSIPYDDPLRVGLIGSYGNRWANIAIYESDLLIVVGSRLDIRQTGADTEGFRGNRTIFHVDVDQLEINNRVTNCHSIVADAKDFLTHAVRAVKNQPLPKYTSWLEYIEKLRAQWPDTREIDCGDGINPNIFMHQLSQVSGQASAFIVDVGQHQMWAAQSIEIQKGQRFLTSGGMGSMGFALPAAIGAAFTNSNPVVMIAGDGGFQCNIQELQTVVRNHLPVKMVVMNNQTHGMVRQFQESYFESRYQSTVWGYNAPNFADVATAYNIPSCTIVSPDETDVALEWLWRDPNSPALLQVMIDQTVNVYPKIAFGRPINQMEPQFSPIEPEGT